MGANPMQKMKRNSILIGLVIGLVIGLIMCVILYMFLSGSDASTTKGETISVCALNKTIKAGTTITSEDVVYKKVKTTDVPSDATSQVLNGIAKIDLTSGTILTKSMITASEETTKDDVREQEYNMLSLPSKLAEGDFIDIRLQLPNGADYIVVSKKQVQECNASTIWLNMNEEEIELMSNAIIEYYIMKGSKLYASVYTEPGIQTASVGTYVPNSSVSTLISSNPNIKNYINQERYSDALKAIRNNNITSSLNQYSEDAIKNIEENMQEEINTLKQTRESYFGALDSASN
jgi:hypothetical protein